MLTKTANELIGKRARVLHSPAHPEFEGQIGTVDRIVLAGNGGQVRLLIAGKPVLAEMPLHAIEYCTCGEGDGCYLCSEKPQELLTSDFPRRARMYLWTPAEMAIYNAVNAVEAVGADPLLTDAVVLLQQAREKVADYVDRGAAK